MESTKQRRMLEIFFRMLKGECISLKKISDEYKVSTKSISRDISDLRNFLAENRELTGNMDIEYSAQLKCYSLHCDEFLRNSELFALTEVMIGARAFSKEELLVLIEKLKRFTTVSQRPMMDEMIRKELYHYSEVRHDCESVLNTLWRLAGCIREKKEITVEYYRMDRNCKEYRLIPVSVMFTDFYFYLIAVKAGDKEGKPVYFRVDRIRRIVEHRSITSENRKVEFDEGLLRERSLFMWPGKLRTIRFEFTGPSVQAVLDKLPTARIIEKRGNITVIEAEVYGDGIRMWLLSQGSWVKVVEPAEFAEEMKTEIEKMYRLY